MLDSSQFRAETVSQYLQNSPNVLLTKYFWSSSSAQNCVAWMWPQSVFLSHFFCTICMSTMVTTVVCKYYQGSLKTFINQIIFNRHHDSNSINIWARFNLLGWPKFFKIRHVKMFLNLKLIELPSHTYTYGIKYNDLTWCNLDWLLIIRIVDYEQNESKTKTNK